MAAADLTLTEAYAVIFWRFCRIISMALKNPSSTNPPFALSKMILKGPSDSSRDKASFVQSESDMCFFIRISVMSFSF